MSVYFPDDILRMICNELYLAQDFPTLFNCALSCKRFAPLALSNLYRIYSQSPNSDDASEGGGVDALQALQRWSIAWRSIILSALDGTTFPYYSYLRFLDLRDLDNMLNDGKFAREIQNKFFSGALSKLLIQKKVTRRKVPSTALDIPKIVEAIGDTISPKASILIERLSGEFGAEAFLRWVPHLPRLQKLELWDGNALADERVHEAVRHHCPKFDSLSIYRWANAQSDQHMSAFLNLLPSNSLKDLTTISSCGLSLETCRALAQQHGESLVELNLILAHEAVPALAMLKNCTSIERLLLDLPSAYDTTAAQQRIHPDMIEWFSKCKRLRNITLHDVKTAPTLLMTILLNEDIHLEELSVSGRSELTCYVVKDNREFHRALGLKRSLKSLLLVGDGENVSRDDIDTLVDSLTRLPDLRSLHLPDVSDFLGEEAAIRLLSSLPLLEEVYMGGYGFTDKVLEAVSSLAHLRSIALFAVTSFTCQGLLDFVERLGPGNENYQLYIYTADSEHLLTDEEQAMVRDALYRRVSGRMDYVPMREPGSEDGSSGSD